MNLFEKIKKSVSLFGLNITKGMIFRDSPKYDKKYDLVICGIFKNEAPFLKEWIEFHNMLGVEHFYLYNNNSEDDYKIILKPYIDSGMVTLIDWPAVPGQLSAYSHFYANYAKDTQWVSFIDIDEFIVPKRDTNIVDWIRKYDKYPVLKLYYKMFGSNGKMEHNRETCVIEQYTSSWENLYSYSKCFLNTDYTPVIDSFFIHNPRIRYNFLGIPFKMPPVDEFRSILNTDCYKDLGHKESTKSEIQINHYWSKAWDVYSQKRNYAADGFFNVNPKKDIQYFLNNENKNISSDFSAYRFLLQLKWRMSRETIEK